MQTPSRTAGGADIVHEHLADERMIADRDQTFTLAPTRCWRCSARPASLQYRAVSQQPVEAMTMS
jgi:hypothetical protein